MVKMESCLTYYRLNPDSKIGVNLFILLIPIKNCCEDTHSLFIRAQFLIISFHSIYFDTSMADKGQAKWTIDSQTESIQEFFT